jgi:hypothetical protein
MIQVDHSPNVLHTMGDYAKSLVLRHELKRLAQAKSLKPKFLFPEIRNANVGGARRPPPATDQPIAHNEIEARAGTVAVVDERSDRGASSEDPREAPGTRSTIAAETRCRAWLAGEMRKGPPAKAKADYEAEGKTLFSVGTRAFNRAWANAISETGNSKWSEPGRKS